MAAVLADQRSATMLKILRRELAIAAIIIVLTLVILIPAVYWVGGKTLGPYGENGTFSTYITDVAMAIARGEPGIWFFVLSPLLAISVVRYGWLLAGKIETKA